VLGDGGALLLLESLESAERRGAKIYCEIMGFTQNCHGYNPLAPEENGNDIFFTMREALVQAGLTPSEVDWFNCHASSTIAGDLSEAKGIKNLIANKNIFDNLEKLADLDLDMQDVSPDDIDSSLCKNISLNALKPYIADS